MKVLHKSVVRYSTRYRREKNTQMTLMNLVRLKWMYLCYLQMDFSEEKVDFTELTKNVQRLCKSSISRKKSFFERL